ncbi:hypothetical protein GA0115234_101114 [Streptomyces sp. DvalAA-43]|nr:hypothetical protein GA0115234_101114 [Streptomyces sp. DvalAA-43]
MSATRPYGHPVPADARTARRGGGRVRPEGRGRAPGGSACEPSAASAAAPLCVRGSSAPTGVSERPSPVTRFVRAREFFCDLRHAHDGMCVCCDGPHGECGFRGPVVACVIVLGGRGARARRTVRGTTFHAPAVIDRWRPGARAGGWRGLRGGGSGPVPVACAGSFRGNPCRGGAVGGPRWPAKWQPVALEAFTARDDRAEEGGRGGRCADDQRRGVRLRRGRAAGRGDRSGW